MNTDKKEEFYYVCATLPSNKFVPKLALHLPPASLSFTVPPRITITKIPQQPKELLGSSNGFTQTRHYFQLKVNGSLTPTQERQLQLVNGVKNSSQKFTIELRTLLRSSHDRQNFFQRRKMVGSDKNGILQILVIPSCNQLNSDVIDKILEQQEPEKLHNPKTETMQTEDSITCSLEPNAETIDFLTKPFHSRACSTVTNASASKEKPISEHMRERSILKCRSVLIPFPFMKETQTIDQPETLLRIEKIASNLGYIAILVVQAFLLTTLMSPSLRA